MESPYRYKSKIPFIPAIPPRGRWKHKNSNSKDTHTTMFRSTLPSTTIWNQPNCPSINDWTKNFWDTQWNATQTLWGKKKKKHHSGQNRGLEVTVKWYVVYIQATDISNSNQTVPYILWELWYSHQKQREKQRNLVYVKNVICGKPRQTPNTSRGLSSNQAVITSGQLLLMSM